MNIIAEYTENGHIYGLTDKPLQFLSATPYSVVFSTTEARSYCSSDLACTTCPFSSLVIEGNNISCQEPITKRPVYYLTLFGITQDTHPEYFI